MTTQSKKNSTKFTVVDHTGLSLSEVAFAERFSGRVIGQPAALQVAQLAYNMAKNPLRDKTRPIGIFYLCGPSRTGKSLTGVALAEIFHNDPEALTRIQASDYTEDHQLLELKGAPPSYVGFRDPKDPKNKLEDHETDPYSVVSPHNLRRVRLASGEVVDIVVIEEFEKSSPDFYKFWMGVFDKGVSRLGNGQVADFRNTIFILTSNLGMDQVERKPIGFRQEERSANAAEIESTIHEAMARTYKPEFRNRLDAVVIFKPFTSDTLMQIVDAEIAVVQKRISDEMEAGKDFMVEVTSEAKHFMLRAVSNNVAELKRVINRDILMPLGRLISTGKVEGGDIVRITVKAEGTALEYAVAKNAYGVGENEAIAQGRGDGTVNLSLQRNIRKAKLGASTQGVQDWHVMFTAPTERKMSVKAASLLETLSNVLELKVKNISYQKVSPYIFSVVVAASREQINVLAQIHAEDDLAMNPAAREALPAPKE